MAYAFPPKANLNYVIANYCMMNWDGGRGRRGGEYLTPNHHRVSYIFSAPQPILSISGQYMALNMMSRIRFLNINLTIPPIAPGQRRMQFFLAKNNNYIRKKKKKRYTYIYINTKTNLDFVVMSNIEISRENMGGVWR
jgi:hypothetical protein